MNNDAHYAGGPDFAAPLAVPVSLRQLFARGDRIEVRGKSDIYRFEGLVGPSWVFKTDKAEPLLLPGRNGLPELPIERVVADALDSGLIKRRGSPLSNVRRQKARDREPTRAEVIARDPAAELRWEVVHWVDRTNPKRDDGNLAEAMKAAFDEEVTKSIYGFYPTPGAVRKWCQLRGIKGDRRWADMENIRGQGKRRKRVIGLQFEMAIWHITRIFSKRGARLSPAAAHRALKRDVNRLNVGKPLKMDRFEHIRDVPEKRMSAIAKSTFYDLCHQLESARNETHRTSEAFVRSRRSGGGKSIEPVRFMSVVQMDETEVPAFLLIDERRRIPLGCAVSTIAVCCHSHSIVGLDVGWEAGSTASWMRTVLNMASLKTVPEEFREEFPDLAYMAGIASAMIFDNAKHYAGLAVQDAGGDLVSDVIRAGEGVATHKGLVERTHHSLYETLIRLLPAHKLPIAVAREWNVDMAGKTPCTMGTLRKYLPKAIGILNTAPRDCFGGRSPIQIMREDRARFSIMMPSDIDQFARAIANVTFDRVFDKAGVTIFGLRYCAPRGNKKLIDDFIQASGDRRKTKNPAFDAKIKIYDHDLSRIGIFNPLVGAYEDLECTRRIYGADLTLSVYKIVRTIVGEKAIKNVPEETLLEIRGKIEDAIESEFPDDLAKEESIHGAILKDPRTLAIAFDRLSPIYTPPSPTGMETVKRDLGIATRNDATMKPTRPSNRSDRIDDDDEMSAADSAQKDDRRRSGDRENQRNTDSALSTYGNLDGLL